MDLSDIRFCTEYQRTRIRIDAKVGYALFVYLTIYRNANPPLTTPVYLTFTLDVFNFCTIIALFVILSLHEQTTAADFGKAMRTNIPTVVAALLINLVYSAKNIWDTMILKIVS